MQYVDTQKLYELAGDKAVTLAEELYDLVYILRREPEIKDFLSRVDADFNARREILDDICRGRSPVFQQLMSLLLEKELLRRVPSIAEKYISLVSQEKRIDFIELRLAHAVEEKQLMEIKKLLGARMKYKTVVDKNIIGGFMLRRTDWKVLDASVRGKLEELKAEIVK